MGEPFFRALRIYADEFKSEVAVGKNLGDISDIELYARVNDFLLKYRSRWHSTAGDLSQLAKPLSRKHVENELIGINNNWVTILFLWRHYLQSLPDGDDKGLTTSAINIGLNKISSVSFHEIETTLLKFLKDDARLITNVGSERRPAYTFALGAVDTLTAFISSAELMLENFLTELQAPTAH